jgi:predicted acylesterase/phospholipase RssA
VETLEPEPLTEEPPFDQYCDLVLTGGVASGVVYPWAILELARTYRFKNIGGTSVGAMAAALAAAAEYGRRTGYPYAFEVLRKLPGVLAGDVGQGTKMLSLFQPSEDGQRIFALLLAAVASFSKNEGSSNSHLMSFILEAIKIYWRAILRRTFRSKLALVFMGIVVLFSILAGKWSGLWWLLPVVTLGCILSVIPTFKSDIQKGIVDNDFGLCRGSTQAHLQTSPEEKRFGLTEWLHEGIQKSAGLKVNDQALTFRDLWNAPFRPGAAARSSGNRERSINLMMLTTNVTHGRPYRLPLTDEATRLFFRPAELANFFPASVMKALVKTSLAYQPMSSSDPSAESVEGDFRELPKEDLPLVIAARLSLSFPVLFSAIPLYAIDYEAPQGKRTLQRCRFSDGGLASNFPIHLFDAAIPRWPTFGIWLDKRTGHYADSSVWLPQFHLDGRHDSWSRFEMDTNTNTGTAEKAIKALSQYVFAIFETSKDWGDRTALRMPHIRNRVARMNLRGGEGQLHIAMPGELIMKMASEYGTAAGRLFVERFAPEGVTKAPSQAWREHLYVRTNMLIASVRKFVTGIGVGEAGGAYSLPLETLIANATNKEPLTSPRPFEDRSRAKLTPEQAKATANLIHALHQLEIEFSNNDGPQPYASLPSGELRVRPPL